MSKHARQSNPLGTMDDRFLASFHHNRARQAQGTLQGAPKRTAVAREVTFFLEPGPVSGARQRRGIPSKLAKADCALALIKEYLGGADQGLRLRWTDGMEVYDSANPADPVNEAASMYLGVELRGLVAVVTPPEG